MNCRGEAYWIKRSSLRRSKRSPLRIVKRVTQITLPTRYMLLANTCKILRLNSRNGKKRGLGELACLKGRFNPDDPRHGWEAQKRSLLGAFFLSDIWAVALQHLTLVCVPDKLGQHLCFSEPKQLILAVHF